MKNILSAFTLIVILQATVACQKAPINLVPQEAAIKSARNGKIYPVNCLIEMGADDMEQCALSESQVRSGGSSARGLANSQFNYTQPGYGYTQLFNPYYFLNVGSYNEFDLCTYLFGIDRCFEAFGYFPPLPLNSGPSDCELAFLFGGAPVFDPRCFIGAVPEFPGVVIEPTEPLSGHEANPHILIEVRMRRGTSAKFLRVMRNRDIVTGCSGDQECPNRTVRKITTERENNIREALTKLKKEDLEVLVNDRTCQGNPARPATNFDRFTANDREFVLFEQIRTQCLSRVRQDRTNPAVRLYDILRQLRNEVQL
ncbi:MAG: hypothetical protein H6617_00875 [Bdellovibrionaceae bacterium]|nr:hypothetical protein [Bdellovibrionales bacterium]MCB9253220.1 hypothetical protein [Pseudobdellovibrionaceae bacterium]